MEDYARPYLTFTPGLLSSHWSKTGLERGTLQAERTQIVLYFSVNQNNPFASVTVFLSALSPVEHATIITQAKHYCFPPLIPRSSPNKTVCVTEAVAARPAFTASISLITLPKICLENTVWATLRKKKK